MVGASERTVNLLDQKRAETALATAAPALTTTRLERAMAGPGNTYGHRRTHGESWTGKRKASPLYGVWSAMKARVNRPSHPDYHRYGGRGIDLCPEWDRYEPFRDWARANGYAVGLSIDRIDNDGGYSPQNCRWTDAKTQARNRQDTSLITYGGVTATLVEHCERIGIRYITALQRIAVLGWTVAEALSTPVPSPTRRKKGWRKTQGAEQ